MKEKRSIRTYKIGDAGYNAAKEKADKTNKPLATRVEEFVLKYGGVKKSPYCASMGQMLIKESRNKKK